MVLATTAVGAARAYGRGRRSRRGATREVRLRAQVRTLVVGDEDFHVWVAATAARARRRVVGHVPLSAEPSPGEAGDHSRSSWGRHPYGNSWQELIVEDRHLGEARLQYPELLAHASRVWLVSSGEGERRRSLFSTLPPVGRAIKRGVDIVLSMVALVLLSPVLVAAMVAVKADSPGPALFSQMRVGANGRRFRLHKIRTMTPDNDDREHRAYYAALVRGEALAEDGLYKLRHDSRLTRVGQFLRRLSIDEIPQFWNVLRGDMSLVGPRPMQPHEIDLCPDMAWQRLRVKPGITGPWQVGGRSRLSFEQMVALDVEYWRSWSLLSDIKILLKTPKAVLSERDSA